VVEGRPSLERWPVDDVFLQVRPGTDAFVLSAMLAVLIEEELIDRTFLAELAGEGQALFESLAACH
jgi:anaerobic selenocysteine-containing dehydrogenase